MPKLSDTMEEGRLIAWRKKVGDSVKRGEVIAEIETDKADMEFEAYTEGVVAQIVVEAGATVPVGTLIAVLRLPGESEAVSAPWRHSRRPQGRDAPKPPASAAAPPEACSERAARPAPRPRSPDAAHRRPARAGAAHQDEGRLRALRAPPHRGGESIDLAGHRHRSGGAIVVMNLEAYLAVSPRQSRRPTARAAPLALHGERGERISRAEGKRSRRPHPEVDLLEHWKRENARQGARAGAVPRRAAALAEAPGVDPQHGAQQGRGAALLRRDGRGAARCAAASGEPRRRRCARGSPARLMIKACALALEVPW
jgi:pyruvate dehydrogenase E2 component (dihydrolipoamide acetyltransferase)